MARRYFNIFKSHIAMLMVILALVFTAEFTNGTVSMVAKIAAGVMMIYAAISYAIWLFKTPTASVKEENL